MDFLHDDRASRPAILAVVIGLHLAALLIPLVDNPRNRYQEFHGPGYMTLTLKDPEPLQLPPPPEVAAWKLTVISPPQPALAPLSMPNEAAPSGSAMAPPDWKQSGADAAADAASKTYRPLGPRAEEPKIKAPRSPFKPPPKHKAGEVGEDALENPVVWLSENCYLRFENRKLPLDDPFRSIPMTLCVFPVGKLEPKGDLFEHLRKPQPLP